MYESLIKFHGDKVLKGTLSIDDVPTFIKKQVEAYVADELYKQNNNSTNE